MSPANAVMRHSPTRQFVTLGVVMMIPVLLLGLVLAHSYQSGANSRGLAEGRSEALLMAQSAIEPLLDGRPLSQRLS